MSEVKDPGQFIFQENTGSKFYEPGQPGKPKAIAQPESLANEQVTPVTLYEYSMGLKDIQASYSAYAPRQAFISTPVHVPGNVVEVELEAGEEHPVFDAVSGQAADRQTAIEYYVSHKASPSLADWQPILPLDTTRILSERLFFEGQRATLRFPAVLDTLVLYENGRKVAADRLTWLSSQSLTVKNRQTDALYTVDYTPDRSQAHPWTVRIANPQEELVTITETFPKGTDFNKTVTLKHTPYVDSYRISQDATYNPNTSAYKPVEVRLVDARLEGRNRTVLNAVAPYAPELDGQAYTYNRTLYKDTSWTPLQTYNLEADAYYGGFDYYHWKNKLVFSEHFNAKQLRENLPYTHGTATIQVTYQTLLSDFRLKAILRRNTPNEDTATPVLHHYRLRFKTIQ